ncbi:MAG: hypothetical protein AB7O52_11000 [Planctomycetota bacterium]
MDLQALLTKYRKGRDGFDGICLEVTRLFLAGRLIPAAAQDEESSLEARLAALSPQDVEIALGDRRGTLLMSRDEYAAVLVDVTAFLKEWQGQ